jgi:hypothetical protein
MLGVPRTRSIAQTVSHCLLMGWERNQENSFCAVPLAGIRQLPLPRIIMAHCDAPDSVTICQDQNRSALLFRTAKTRGTPWPESAYELYRRADSRLSAKLIPIFGNRGVSLGQRNGSLTAVISVFLVNATDPYSRILGFLDWSRYFLFKVATELYSREIGPRSRPTS